jgi:hypothetical protein
VDQFSLSETRKKTSLSRTLCQGRHSPCGPYGPLVKPAFSHIKLIMDDRKHHLPNDLLCTLLFIRTNARVTTLRTPNAEFGVVLEDPLQKEVQDVDEPAAFRVETEIRTPDLHWSPGQNQTPNKRRHEIKTESE